MYRNKQDLVEQEILVSDLNCHIRQVKDEIRSTFASHVSTLLSREQWLLDQVDSIKEEMMNQLMTKKLSDAKTKASMQVCAEFLKFSKNRQDEIGVKCTEGMMQIFNQRLKESSSENQIPDITFVHERSELHQTLARYGKLETGACGEHLDEESVDSERSWDLLDEKKEECLEMIEKESESDDTISLKSACCGNGMCGKSFTEIEDMDMSKYQLQPDDEAKDMPKKSLKNICKANELCQSISECVCDEPCNQRQAVAQPNYVEDPVASLQARFKAVYTKNEEDIEPFHMETEFSKSHDLCGMDPVIKAHTLMNKALKTGEKSMMPSKETSASISQLARRLQYVLESSNQCSDFGEYPCEVVQPESNGSKKDVVHQLHSRLQSIVCKQSPIESYSRQNDADRKSEWKIGGCQSSNHVARKSKELNGAVSSEKEKKADQHDRITACNGNVEDLSERLARIYAPKLPKAQAQLS